MRSASKTIWSAAKEAFVATTIEGVGPGVKIELTRSVKNVAMMMESLNVPAAAVSCKKRRILLLPWAVYIWVPESGRFLSKINLVWLRRMNMERFLFTIESNQRKISAGEGLFIAGCYKGTSTRVAMQLRCL